MITILLDDLELNFSNYGITTIEKSNIFRDEQTKTFTYPFELILTPEIAKHFKLANVDNIDSYKTRLDVKVLDNFSFYDGYLKISKIIDKKASVRLFYGYEVLPIYTKYLSSLNFEKISVPDIFDFAKSQNLKHWPDATHNFVTVRDANIVKNTDYKYFEGFINNTSDTGDFIENSFVTEGEGVDAVSVAANKNVMMPMPYLMELLKVGYASENKIIKGSFVEDPFNHKILCLPNTFLVQFITSELDVSSIDTPTVNYVFENKVYSSYKKTYNPTSTGSYSLYFTLNLTNIQAKYFKLTVKEGSTTLYSLFSENQEVSIKEIININVVSGNVNPIHFELILLEQPTSLSDTSFLKFEYKESKLNVSGNDYSLADFMPDATFKELANFVENFFNVEITTLDNIAYLNYVDEKLPNIIFDDHSEYNSLKNPRYVNKEKVFGIKYDDDSEIYVNKSGVIPSKNASLSDDLVTINIPVIPLTFETFNDKITATNSTESTVFKLLLYNGLQDSKPLATPLVNGKGLTINDMYLRYENWFKIRTNSELIEDTFFAPSTAKFNINRGCFKNNKKHLVKEIRRTAVKQGWNKVTLKLETV